MEEIKLAANGKFVRCGMEVSGDRIFLKTPFNKTLIAEIKSFEGSKWHGYDKENPRKLWSIKNSGRNIFQLSFLMGKNPYERYDDYDKNPVECKSDRSLYNHQIEMVRHGLTVHYGVWAAEMGVGKSLSAIEVMEQSGFKDWYWVGPRSALKAARLEFSKWECKVKPVVMTYEGLRNTIGGWIGNDKAPHGVIFDESSKVKTPTALRSQAAMQLAEGIRDDWGLEGICLLLSGSPAPKSPADWYFQAEIACPGFLKEGDFNKFKSRLGLIVQREQQITGGTYPALVTWLDDETKCKECGEFEGHNNHNLVDTESHHFAKSKNEVEALYRRMRGLVVVIFKDQCLDLPKKTYKIIECVPTESILQVAKTLINTSARVITGLTLSRELSDGFQYREEIVGKETCPRCKGKGEVNAAVYKMDEEDEEIDAILIAEKEGRSLLDIKMSKMGPSEDEEVEEEMIICDTCGGSKEVNKKERIIQEVPCPKVDVLIDLLDQYDEVGRVVIYGGFTGSIDRITRTCTERKWIVLRVDGRGWHVFAPESVATPNSDDLLVAMDRTHPRRDELLKKYPRIAFVGQPGAAGMGLNLTASPVIIYYSNDFNAESRIQSEDRIHRSGMDVNLGATIIDIIHLETDVLILENLKKKRDLQAMSLGAMKNCMTMKLPREVDTIVYGGENKGEDNA